MGGLAAILAIWLIIGIAIGGGVGYAIGKGKGRGTAGFWLGAILGVIGWIIVAVMEPTDQVRRARQAESLALAAEISGHDPSVPTRPCPDCAELIKAAAKVCRYCGREVEPFDPQVERWNQIKRESSQDLWNALYENATRFERSLKDLEDLLAAADLTAPQVRADQCERIVGSPWSGASGAELKRATSALSLDLAGSE